MPEPVMVDVPFETRVTDLLSRFLKSPVVQLHAVIAEAQALLCDFLDADLSAIWRHGVDSRTIRLVHLHHRLEVPSLPYVFDLERWFPWCGREIAAGRAIVASPERPSQMAGRDRRSWRCLGVRCAIVIPLQAEGQHTLGVLVIASLSGPRPWSEETIGRIGLVAQAMAYALVREEAERALRRSEAKYRSLFDSASDAIMLVRDGRFVDCNAGASTMFGCQRDQLIGTSPAAWSPSTQPDGRGSAEKVADLIGLALADRPQRFEWEHHRFDGTSFTAEVSLNRLDVGGEHLVQAIIRDITERKRMEALLEDSDRRFRALSESSLSGVFILEDGRLSYLNGALADIFGYAHEEMVGVDPILVVHPDDHVVVEELIRAGVSGELEALRLELHGVRKSGEMNRILVLAKRVDLGGRIVIIGNVLDITERVKAEERSLLLSMMLDEAPVGVIVHDGAQEILYSNPHAAHLHGYSREAFACLRLTDLVAPELRQNISNRLRQIQPQGDIHFETRHVRSDGMEIPLEVHCKNVEWNGQSAVLSLQTDLTEKRGAEARQARVEAQLVHAQQMEAIGTLAAGFAHDFNNVLTPILGFSELALAAVDADAECADFLATIHAAAGRAADLVRQILLLSRSHESAEPAPVEVGPLVKETVRLLRAALPANIEIQGNVLPDCPLVLGDATQLHQVILNLCTNARDAMSERGGALTISLRPAGPHDHPPQAEVTQWVVLSVSDTGCGMTPEVQRKIFDPYFTTKPRGKGTGLGLAVSQGIIAALGGELRVVSVPGEGSTFEVVLPAVVGQKRASPVNGLIPRGSDERVLVVDDEPAVRATLVRILRSLGYRASEVASARRALAVLRSAPRSFDVVVMDETMPDMMGGDLAAACRLIRADLPILHCTGWSEDEPDGLGPSCATLRKPFTIEDVAEALRRVLSPQHG